MGQMGTWGRVVRTQGSPTHLDQLWVHLWARPVLLGRHCWAAEATVLCQHDTAAKGRIAPPRLTHRVPCCARPGADAVSEAVPCTSTSLTLWPSPTIRLFGLLFADLPTVCFRERVARGCAGTQTYPNLDLNRKLYGADVSLEDDVLSGRSRAIAEFVPLYRK